MGFPMTRSSLLTGIAALVATLVALAASLSSGAEAYAQARRNASPVMTVGGILGQ
jgi:hypothetical protein